MGGGHESLPDFNNTGFDFQTMTPVHSDHTEPDSAAGIAWLMYLAYTHHGKAEYKQATIWALSYLEQCSESPLYEMLLPFGALTAARFNKEQGYTFNVTRLVEWSLSDGHNEV